MKKETYKIQEQRSDGSYVIVEKPYQERLDGLGQDHNEAFYRETEQQKNARIVRALERFQNS